MHLQRRANNNDAQGQCNDGTDFQESGEVVTRSEQQPHRQHGSDETVDHHCPGDRQAFQIEDMSEGAFSHVFTIHNRQYQQDKADDRNLADFARTDIAGVDTHKQSDWDGSGDGEGTPRAVDQGFHHNQRQHGHDDHHNHQNTDGGNHAGYSAQLLFHDIAQGFTVTAHGHEQHHRVLNRTGKHHAENNPQRAGQVTHLRGQYRTYQRAGASDGGKMVAEQHAFVRRHIVQAIVMALGRREPVGIELHYIFGNVETIKAVGNGIYGDGSNHHPHRTDLLTAMDSQSGKGGQAGQHHNAPYQEAFEFVHDNNTPIQQT